MNNQMQQQISSLYDLLTDNPDFRMIKCWLLDTCLGQNENFLFSNYQLNLQIQVVRKDLNKLSENIEELQRLIKKCCQIFLIEQEKEQSLKKHYKKYLKNNVDIESHKSGKYSDKNK